MITTIQDLFLQTELSLVDLDEDNSVQQAAKAMEKTHFTYLVVEKDKTPENYDLEIGKATNLSLKNYNDLFDFKFGQDVRMKAVQSAEKLYQFIYA